MISYAPPPLFKLFLAVTILLIGREWLKLIFVSPLSVQVSFGLLLSVLLLGTEFFPVPHNLILLLSLWYLYAAFELSCYAMKRPINTPPLVKAVQGFLCLALFYLYSLLIYSSSPRLALACIGIICAIDIGGYAGGKLIGGKKLLPHLSPHKTYAGVLGGILLCYMTYGLIVFFIPSLPLSLSSLALLLPVCLIAQAGDFYQSMLKRQAHLKDSGKWLLGHGGIFDRTDALIFGAPAFYAFLCVSAF